MTNLIFILLSIKKLTSDSFNKEKSNLSLILIIKNVLFVLKRKCTFILATNTIKFVCNAYKCSIESKNEACYYLFIVMDDVIMMQHKKLEITYGIMDSLQLMFSRLLEQTRHKDMKPIMMSR